MFILVEPESPISELVAMENALRRVRNIADYQYGTGAGNALFPDDVRIEYSHSTGKIRYISCNSERLATLRPTDGLLSISVAAARKLVAACPKVPCLVTVRQDVVEFVAKGGDVFAVHVVKVNDEVHAKDEVVVLDEEGNVVAIGRAFLSAEEMLAFKTGVAVKIRRGKDD